MTQKRESHYNVRLASGQTQQFANYYFHTPYCETKCHYCDFFSLPEDRSPESERARIYSAILNELKSYASVVGPKVDTIFFGGGTPSLAPLETMQSFVEQLPVESGSEVTMEANPSSIAPERARAWRALGINRISMGTQALNDERLKWLGRVHDKSEIFQALDALFEAGFKNVSIDYIVGVPDQTQKLISEELNEVLGRFPLIRHVSAYLLTLKPSNPKHKQLPSDDEQLAHLRAVRDALLEQGFEQYEISNFARPDSRARHNENYWLGGSYLGIGPSAHSFWDKQQRRTKNWASLGKYEELINQGQKPVEWEESLTIEQMRLEYIMLRLRRSAGIDLKEYQSLFGRDLLSDNRSWVDFCLNRGLCLLSDRLQLTADGYFLSDQIISKIN